MATPTLAACTKHGKAEASGGSAANAAPAAHAVVVNDTPAEEPPTSSLSVPVHIACAGDSITYGYGVEATRDSDSYPAQLQALLHEAGSAANVENFGLCGACALSSGKNPYLDFAEYYDSLDAAADLVILMLGTNDAASALWDREQYEEELTAYVGSYQQASNNPQVLLMVPPNILSNTWAGGVPAGRVDEMQEAVRCVAVDLNLACVDLEPLFGEDVSLFSDGVHPNAEGNALIAHALFDELCSRHKGTS